MKDWSVSAVLLGIGVGFGSFAALVAVARVGATNSVEGKSQLPWTDAEGCRHFAEWTICGGNLSSGDGDACVQVFDATPSSKNGLYCRPTARPIGVRFGHISDGPPLVSADGEWVLDQVGGELIDLKAGGITR